jgi:hypothetical protein
LNVFRMAFKRSGVRLPLAPPISNFSLWRGGKTYGEAQHWRQLSVLIELAASFCGTNLIRHRV